MLTIPHVGMPTCLYADVEFSGNPIESVFFKKQINRFFSQTLCRAFQIKRQHTKLLPSLRRQIDGQDALALAAWWSGLRLYGRLLCRGDFHQRFRRLHFDGSRLRCLGGKKRGAFGHNLMLPFGHVHMWACPQFHITTRRGRRFLRQLFRRVQIPEPCARQ